MSRLEVTIENHICVDKPNKKRSRVVRRGFMSNTPRMLTRSQVKQYNSFYTLDGELLKLLKNNTKLTVNQKVSNVRNIYELVNKNFHFFVEYDTENGSRIRVFNAAYHASLQLIPDLKSEINGSKLDNECYAAIQEIEKFQINYNKYYENYPKNEYKLK